MTALFKRTQQGFVWMFSGGFLIKLFGISSTIVMLSQLSVYEYGLVILVLSVVPALSFFYLPGFVNMITVDMGVAKGTQNFGELKTIFVQYASLQVILGIIAWGIIFFGADFLGLFFKGLAPDLLRILSLVFLITPLRMLIQVLTGVYQDFFSQTFLFVVEEGVKLILILVGLLYLKLGPQSIIIAHVVAPLLSSLFFLPRSYQLIKDFWQAPMQSGSIFSRLFSHGKWNISGSYVNSFNKSFRLWIIRFTLGTEAVGIFSLAQNLISYASSLFPLHNVINLIMPHYAGDRLKMNQFITKSIKYQFFGVMIISIFMLLLVPPLLDVFFPEYTLVTPLLFILLPSLLLSSFGSLNQLFTIYKKQKSLFRSYTYKVISTGLFAPVFTTWFGLSGAAFEHVVTSTVHIFDRYRTAHRTFDWFTLHLRDFWRIDEVDRIIFRHLRTQFSQLFSRRTPK